MQELIKVTEQNGEQLVSARELHEFLEVTERFNSWFERQLQYGFEESVDFTGCKFFHTQANQEIQEYILKLDMAKEISMLQRTEKGRQARQYFIACEKKLKSLNPLDMLLGMNKEQLALTTLELTKQIAESKPKVEYYDKVLKSNETFTTTQVAKIFSMSAQGLNKQLELEGIQYKQRGTWLLKAKYQDKGYAKIDTIIISEDKTRKQLVWTEKGIQFISDLLDKL